MIYLQIVEIQCCTVDLGLRFKTTLLFKFAPVINT